MPPPFERYRPLIDDWCAFAEAISRPLPTCLWVNPLRATPAQVADILTADGLEVAPLPWRPGAFKLPADFKPGRHWSYLAGLVHVQEEVSLLPVWLLDPQPGERILDLCAAPGNKTAQIAARLGDGGTVVANDINAGRMRAVRQALERLGLVNVSTTVANGANYPPAAGQFDRVLVDAPCSCEGTSRKEPAVVGRIGLEVSLKKSGLQLALLRKAVQLCKPGGRIVYATCTYAPEENELVIDELLRDSGESLRLLPAAVANFTADPGLTAWQGQPLHPALAHTVRVWPHQNDSGGFFVAVLEKAATDPAPPPPVLPPLDYPPPPPALLAELADRFGLAAADFAPAVLFQTSRRRLYAANPDHLPPPEPAPDAIGMQVMKTRTRLPKLSTAAAQKYGPRASRNRIELDAAQMWAYVNRENLFANAAQTQSCTGEGYVLVSFRGFVLGVAVFYPKEAGGVVVSMFPKGWMPNKS